MKLYVHWQVEQPFTKVVKLDDASTIVDLREACWDALKARLPCVSASGPSAVLLLGPDARPLPLSSHLPAVLSSGDDVFCSLTAVRDLPGHQVPSGAALLTSTTHSEAAASQPVGPRPAAPPETVTTSVPTAVKAAAPAAATAAAVNAPGGIAPSVGGSGPRAAAADGDDQVAVLEPLLPLVHTLWTQAEAAVAQHSYRSAADTLQQALLLAPKPSQPAHTDTLQRLARVWLAAGNPAAAVPWVMRAAEARPEDPGVMELAGDCLREGGRPHEAAPYYQSALELLEDQLGEAGGTGAPGADPAAAAAQLRTRLSLAACLYDIPGCVTPPYDNQDLAASLVMAVLESDPAHWDALRLYGRIALDRGIRDDALRVALRLVVARPQHAGAKALLAECLKGEEGCRQLLEELGAVYPPPPPPPPPPQSGSAPSAAGGGSEGSGAPAGAPGGSPTAAAALGFVATAIKDHGQVDSCIALLQHAVRLDPRSASFCLNLVHALELRQDLQAAVRAGRAYCRRSGTQLAGLPLKEVDCLLSDLPELRCATELSWYLAPPLWGGAGGAAQLRGPAAGADAGCEGPEAAAQALLAAGQEGAGGGAPQAGAAPAGSAGAGASSGAGKGEVQQVAYTPDQLDELALLFTLAKVLFVGGALGLAARLCELVEPLRRASAVELHTTLIRNEAAYFGCVMQLLRDHPPPPARLPALQPPPPQPPPQSTHSADAGPSEGDAVAAGGAGPARSAARPPAPLFLCGDSHCLSAAWRVVALRGEERLLRPLLVTGCKVWHLRPSSVFYPKKQFEASMQAVPEGSQVVLVLGEIDCREGLLLAVQKGKYASVAEGIDATVSIYMHLLRRLVSERSLELFVHPVPPVLSETRHIVTPFTAALKRAIAAARATDTGLRSKLHYLDFFQDLLAPAAKPSTAAAGATATPAAPTATAAAGPAVPVAAGAAAPGTTATGTSSSRSLAVSAPVVTAEQVVEEPSTAGAGQEAGGAGARRGGVGFQTGGKRTPAAAARESGDEHGDGSDASMGMAGPQTDPNALNGAEASEGTPGSGKEGGECGGGAPGGPSPQGTLAAVTAGQAVKGAVTVPGLGWVLRQDLAFDGTHLAPAYVSLLSAALEALQ